MLGIDYSSSEEEAEDSDDQQRSCENKEVDKEVDKSIANPFDANNYESSSEDESSDSRLVFDRSQAGQQSSVPVVVPEISGPKNTSDGQKNDLSAENPSASKVSIFSNPFKEEEKKELSQLERHVKMTDNKTVSGQACDKTKNRYGICWSWHKYKKCKFGNRCRFVHNDTDFIDTKAIKRNDNVSKKRVGITDSLVPPKRAMKAYFNQSGAADKNHV